MTAGRALAPLLLALAPLAAHAEDPAVGYMLECQGCHRPDGSGGIGGVPDFRDRVGLLALEPEGRAYLVRVPGSAQAPFDDAQLADVLNWIVRRFGPADAAARFRPFDAAEVSHHRAAGPLTTVD